MLKVRVMGTSNEILWYKKLMGRHKKIKILRESENFPNKGTKRYYRSYMEIDKNEE